MRTLRTHPSFVPSPDELNGNAPGVVWRRAGHPDQPDDPAADYAEYVQSERERVIIPAGYREAPCRVCGAVLSVPERTPNADAACPSCRRQYIAPEPDHIEVVIAKLGSNQYRVKVRRPDFTYVNCGTQGSEAAAWDVALLVAQAILAGAA